MNNAKAKLLLHPVRMRIIQTLVTGNQFTVSEMLDILSDIPQATLYRHLKKLLDANILKVTQETKIRGAVEKVYALADQGAGLSREEIENATKEEHLNFFMTFISHMLGDYNRYLDQEKYDLFEDGVSYRKASINLTDKERQIFMKELGMAFSKVINNEPSQNRKTFHISTVMIPEAKDKEEKDNK